ncbi:MAG: cytochrome P450 [Stellaceae bacterium]
MPDGETSLGGAAAGDLIPPFPSRPKEPLSPLAALLAARRNFLSIWHEKSFEYQFFSTRVLARPLFVCNSPDTVAAAFITHHDSFQRKTPQQRHALAPLLGDSLFISNGELWRQRRRIVAPIVHASQLPLFAPIMVEAAAETAERWARLAPGSAIDALREMATLTAEIICRTVFGRRLGAGHAHRVAASFSTYQRLVGRLDLLSLLGLPDWLPRPRAPAIGRAAAEIHRVLDDLIAGCRARSADGEASMISLLLEARDEETGARLDARAVRNEAAVLFMAGHETTASSLAWTWYLLSQAPRVEERLHHELDTVLGGRLPTLDDIPRLLYTRAVFEETLRLYPPVPMLGREALREEKIRNRPVPRGALVMVVPWLLHRHRKFWDCPDHFIPERFLPEQAALRPRHLYVPFSTGPRVCAGAAFGLTEAILCLATLAQRVRLSLAPGAAVTPVCRLTLRPGDHLPMRIDHRD